MPSTSVPRLLSQGGRQQIQFQLSQDQILRFASNKDSNIGSKSSSEVAVVNSKNVNIPTGST